MRTYRILSIDGGGIKGILPAAWLVELEKQVGPLHEHFDLLAGTSSGSLITCGLASGKSAAEILSLFESDISKAFSPLWKRWYYKMTNPLGATYPASGINSLLEEQFGDMKFGDLKSHVMAVTYSLIGTLRMVDPHDDSDFLIIFVLPVNLRESSSYLSHIGLSPGLAVNSVHRQREVQWLLDRPYSLMLTWR